MDLFPKISIIIPLFNVEEFIIECLESVARQTYRGTIECIIIDDCGTDNSVKLVEEFIKCYNGHIVFKILHHKYNRGLSAARNTGIEHATGDYLYFLDSDDYISDDCIEVLSNPLKRKWYDIIIGMYECFGDTYDIGQWQLNNNDIELLDEKEIFKHFYVTKDLFVMAWNKLIKTSLFRMHNLSFLEGQLHEDELWTYKLTCYLQSLYYLNRSTYFYRMRQGSIAFDRTKDARKRCESHYDTLIYSLENRKIEDDEMYNACIFNFVDSFFRYMNTNSYIDFKRYVKFRKLFGYNPFKRYLKNKISLLDIKHQFHYILPPYLGWFYLKLKRYKNTK